MPPKKSSVYTRRGDTGQTYLYNDSNRHFKSEPIFHLLGKIDQLSSHIGCVLAHLPKQPKRCNLINAIMSLFFTHRELDNTIVDYLRLTQRNLLDISTWLSIPRDQAKNKLDLDDEKLEQLIDLVDSKNTPLTNFILPGVYPADAEMHLCRVTCREVERLMVDMFEMATDIASILRYVNRLSDLFFVLSRYLSGCQEFERYDL